MKIEIVKLFNEFFVNIVKKLRTIYKRTNSSFQRKYLLEVEINIAKYRNHAGINAITEKMEKLGNPKFDFYFNSYEETVKEVNNLKIKKVSQKTDISVKILKENIDIVSYFLYHNLDNWYSPNFSVGFGKVLMHSIVS